MQSIFINFYLDDKFLHIMQRNCNKLNCGEQVSSKGFLTEYSNIFIILTTKS